MNFLESVGILSKSLFTCKVYVYFGFNCNSFYISWKELSILLNYMKGQGEILFTEYQIELLFVVYIHKVYYLVDPASSHMLVSKIKPCKCKYNCFTVKLRMAH